MKLPAFEEHWYEIEDKKIMTAYKKLEKKWLNGEKIDIGRNIGYLSVFVRERQLDFFEHQDVKKLIADLGPVLHYDSDEEEFYPRLQAESVIEDAYLTIQDYDGYWNTTYGIRMKNFTNRLQKLLWFQDIFNIYLKCSAPIFDGALFIACVGVNDAKITKFGREHVFELFDVMNSYVEDFTEREGMNPFGYFFHRYAEHPLTPKQADELKPFIKTSRFDAVKKSYFFVLKQERKEKDEYDKWVKNDPSVVRWKPADFSTKKEYKVEYNRLKSDIMHRYEHRNYRLMGTDRNGRELYIPYLSFHQFIYEAFEGFCNQMMRTCENILRKKKNIPKIGEGWVGETTLYYLIKESFPKETVINHGKPQWLGRQHLDIFFPNRNIAIEYQGVQHDRPVAFFGGEERFREQKERDERKARLCRENGCLLIYVREGYRTKEILFEVEKALNNNREKTQH